ncbi:sialin-like, partial [Musca vetustissima]|uniref:sialin-like n=1 Tax=Musca vetustissima TaxID=27455 RepID=UPI002AB63869
QARTVLWYLVFFGFALNYMIRINLNIAIVEMVVQANTRSLGKDAQEPADHQLVSSTYEDLSVTNSSNGLIYFNMELPEFWNESAEQVTSDQPSGFNWNEYEQGLVLGSFFWAHWISQIPGGIWGRKYGTKLVFGLANGIGCWLCFLIPAAAHWDYRALIVLRVVQGLVAGLAWPSMHVLTGKWIPPNERSKFVTAYLGNSVGVAAFYPLFGFVMHWASWPWVFHISGILGVIWWLGWQYFVYDSPAQHPRISASEVSYIEKSLGESVDNETNVRTPWRALLLSRPVWMNVIAQWGSIWGLFTLMTQAPTYFRVLHNWNIQTTGILSGLPHLMRILFAIGFSFFADYLLKTEKMSRTNIRKLATTFCCIIKGLVVVTLAYFGQNATAAIVLYSVATMFHGAVSSGSLASMVDITPNFAGIVMGLSSMIGVLPGFISPYIVGLITLDNQTFEAWKYVFLLAASMLLGSGILYVAFADSTLQKWNDYKARENSDDEESRNEVR